MSSVPAMSRRSLKGRPRLLTDAKIEELLAWADARVTIKQKAAEEGISPGLLHIIIKTRGQNYKQPSPEQRPAVVAARAQRRQQLAAAALI